MLNLSQRFKDRVSSLYQSQRNRGRQKQGPSGRISKKGYDLPFDQKQFTAWFIDKFGGVEGGVIRCRYCNKPVDAYSCVVDHEVPLKRGGSAALSNLGLPCEACSRLQKAIKLAAAMRFNIASKTMRNAQAAISGWRTEGKGQPAEEEPF